MSGTMLTGWVSRKEEGSATKEKGRLEGAPLCSAGEAILVEALIFGAARGLAAIELVTAPVGLT